MSKELGEKRDRAHVPYWIARAIGVTSVASMLMIPAATQSLDSTTQPFDSGHTFTPEAAVTQPGPLIYDERTGLTRDTGVDMQPCADFKVCGTDIGHPFLLPNRDVGYLFGDTLAVAGPFLRNLPPDGEHYRAQVMLRSNEMPIEGQPIIFDSAVGLEDTGEAPETLGRKHILMNDGVGLPNGDIIVSYQHTVAREDQRDHTWYTDYAGLAISHDGDHFELLGPVWENDYDNSDPYQMWSMQRDGDYVYTVSVRAGRQEGPMMLFRSRWDQMLDQDAYEYWDGAAWGEKANATPIMHGHFGEPSLRKLTDGTWAMSYTDYTAAPKVMTHTILDPNQGPEGTWSEPKIQLTSGELKNPYGGGIHPYSTADNLILMISTWQTKGAAKDIADRELVRYDLSHLVTTTD